MPNAYGRDPEKQVPSEINANEAGISHSVALHDHRCQGRYQAAAPRKAATAATARTAARSRSGGPGNSTDRPAMQPPPNRARPPTRPVVLRRLGAGRTRAE